METLQLFSFTPATTWLVNVILWVMLHLGIGYSTSRIPVKKINPERRFYQAFRWEKEGAIYQKLFKIRSWKHLIPQGSKIYPDGYSLQHLKTHDSATLDRWIRESIRSEFCHWVMIIPGFFFFLWNNVIGSSVIMAYAVLTNLVPIILQRFNRPRVRHLLEQSRRGKTAVIEPRSPAK